MKHRKEEKHKETRKKTDKQLKQKLSKYKKNKQTFKISMKYFGVEYGVR